MKRGVATFTLDGGHCPPWLFERMVRLGREMVRVLIEEYGPDEFVYRMSDPVWFQSLGTVLAFDWNASGLTTVLIGALKEAIKDEEKNLGLFICGGKGATSRKTPSQIEFWSEKINFAKNASDQLVENSKMSAKVDSALVQDGYELYHHAFFFSKNGAWTVVQQGMNKGSRTARRYHWFDRIAKKKDGSIVNQEIDFVNEPQRAIAAQTKHMDVLNLVAGESGKTRDVSVDLINRAGYEQIKHEFELLRMHQNKMSQMMAVAADEDEYVGLKLSRRDFYHHPVEFEEFATSKYLDKIIQKLSDQKPADYKSLVATEGVGAKTVRALALVAEVLYGAQPSYTDPARYSFAHGGKDGFPFPVDKTTYDATIEVMKKAVKRSHMPLTDKQKALGSLLDK